MAGRYLVTGVQLGMLSVLTKKERVKMIDKIVDEQFIGNSVQDVKKDAKWIANRRCK